MKLLDTSVAVDYLRGAEAATTLLRDFISAGETIAASEVVQVSNCWPGYVWTSGTLLEEVLWRCSPGFPVDEAVVRTAAALARRLPQGVPGH